MVRVSGISPPMDIRSFNNDINTLERAVKERVFYVKSGGVFVPPPTPKPKHFYAQLQVVYDRLRPLLPRTVPLTREAFVATFRGRKQKMYEDANQSLLRHSFSDKDAKVKVFVKYEKTDFTRKTDPVPRVISPRSSRYNIELGRYLRPLEERVFRSLAKLFGHLTVFKGLNASQSGRIMSEKWHMFRKPVAIGVDAARFDQHVSVDALKWEHMIYGLCFPCKRHRTRIATLLKLQLYNKCSGFTEDGKLKYTTIGGRMSGDMNTSLGNCLLMCSMIYAYSLEVGVNIQLANNGDDCVIFLEQEDLARFQEGFGDWFLAMGFNMVVEDPCYQFEAIEFCQTHPVRVAPGIHDFIMVRHPKWGIAKDTVCIHPWQDPRMFRGWLHSVGVGGLAMAGAIPIFQEFYATYVRFGVFHKSTHDAQSWGVRQLGKNLHRGYDDVLSITRASFYWAYGVTPDEQLVIEDFYKKVFIGDDLICSLSYQDPMPL